LTTTDLFNDITKTILATIVGTTSIAAVFFLQTINGVCKYGVRAAMHSSAAIDLRDLYSDLKMIQVRLQSPSGAYQQGVSKMSEEDIGDYATLESRYRQSLQGCKSSVSMAIAECFYLLDSELDLGNTKYANRYFEEMGISHWVYLVWQRGIDRVPAEITHSKSWPLFTPDSIKVVNTTMACVKSELHHGQHYWESDWEGNGNRDSH
jgi:hypothetical protein